MSKISSNTLHSVLHHIYLRPTTVQSNYAREFDTVVAALASMGYITTKSDAESYGRIWRVTETGIHLLKAGGLL